MHLYNNSTFTNIGLGHRIKEMTAVYPKIAVCLANNMGCCCWADVQLSHWDIMLAHNTDTSNVDISSVLNVANPVRITILVTFHMPYGWITWVTHQDIFKDTLVHFQPFFGTTWTSYSSQRVGPSPSVIVVAKTCTLIQIVIFFPTLTIQPK